MGGFSSSSVWSICQHFLGSATKEGRVTKVNDNNMQGRGTSWKNRHVVCGHLLACALKSLLKVGQ